MHDANKMLSNKPGNRLVAQLPFVKVLLLNAFVVACIYTACADKLASKESKITH